MSLSRKRVLRDRELVQVSLEGGNYHRYNNQHFGYPMHRALCSAFPVYPPHTNPKKEGHYYPHFPGDKYRKTKAHEQSSTSKQIQHLDSNPAGQP